MVLQIMQKIQKNQQFIEGNIDMGNVKIINKVFRLKFEQKLYHKASNTTLELRNGEEFHIVLDVLYMSGYPVPIGLQKFLIDWINDNPSLFVNDTRNF